VEHNLFKPKSIEEGKHEVVGDCNGFTMQQRWEAETPAFAKSILKQIKGPLDHKIRILDYGCGVGRLAKEVLTQEINCEVVGVDASSEMMQKAVDYVGNVNFTTSNPQDLGDKRFDLVYCVYVLQHCPSIEIRDVLYRIYHHLKDDGVFVYCSSDYRMCIRFDGQGFFDDRFLGVNLREEIGRLFEEVSPLFTESDFKDNPVLKKMITGCDGGLEHPAFVYKKKKITGQYFDAKVDKKEECKHERTIPEEYGSGTSNGCSVNANLPSKKCVDCGEKLGKLKDDPRFKNIFEEDQIDYSKFTKLVLVNRLAPGDILVMTNAIRDLNISYPNKYQIDVRTPCNDIFTNNPHITKLKYNEDRFNEINNKWCQTTHNENDALLNRIRQGERDLVSKFLAPIDDVLAIDMHYPLIHRSGTGGSHFSEGHSEYLSDMLGVGINQTDLRPELYLTENERNWISPVSVELGYSEPYWVINAGSKSDFQLKQYPFYQEVVNLLKGKVQFVQIGVKGHNHTPLEGVLDMVGKTDNHRTLYRTIFHAQGVLTCVSYPMHIAAAFNKPCVVVAGAREGTRWELYPNHQFLYVNGCLPCATYDGCWKSKIEECVNKINNVAKCMTLIEPEDVSRAIQRYYKGGVLC
jgi:ADP-heptose:LPS heptosyltransferase/ubiquinone/menaquinone biosynthesis C-methylase UbiE